MHDIRDLEDLGVVAVAVASSEFRQAAAAQNRSLGYDPAVVFVPHPIQDRTDAEMGALADEAVESILKSLTIGDYSKIIE
jgi:alkanesulfonate monooxygenase SsuD/methylene tetrahydromethanopterin reductase-like flavin-dependent oxidoreductase (luciferase family)